VLVWSLTQGATILIDLCFIQGSAYQMVSTKPKFGELIEVLLVVDHPNIESFRILNSQKYREILDKKVMDELISQILK